MKHVLAFGLCLLMAGPALAGFSLTEAGPYDSDADAPGSFIYSYAGDDFLVGDVVFSGTLTAVIAGTWASEARINITAAADHLVFDRFDLERAHADRAPAGADGEAKVDSTTIRAAMIFSVCSAQAVRCHKAAARGGEGRRGARGKRLRRDSQITVEGEV